MGWYIFGLIVVLIIKIVISIKFAVIAENKGYSSTPYFWACFLLGTLGYCIVASLTDLRLQARLDKLAHTISDMAQSTKVTAASNVAIQGTPDPTRNNPPTPGTWTCKHCGTNNSLNYGQCKKCSKYRS